MRFLLALLVAGIVVAAPVAAGTEPPRIAWDSGLTTSHPDVITTAWDGSNPINLTPGTPDFFTMDMHPSWSPDGTKIVFDSHRDSNVSTEIYVMNADGSDQTRLTFDSGQSGIFNSNPLWSPRGDLIEYEKSVDGQDDNLWVMRPDGSDPRPLTSDGGFKVSVSWSPDGTRLVYARNESTGSRIYTVGLDGTPPRAVSPAGEYDSYPAWSPDGSQIAFAAPTLTVMNADGSNRHQVSDLPAQNPAWSPDGSHIAFAGMRAFPQYGSRFGIPTRQDVFVVGVDGNGLRRLTGPFGDARFFGPGGFEPTWWPDGSRLFYVSRRAEGPDTTFVMNADGSCQSDFGPITPDIRHPVWQPGGGPLPPITRCAELRVSFAVGKEPVALNEPAPFTISVVNAGNVPARNVLLRISAPGATLTDYNTGSGECGGAGAGRTDILCRAASLAPGVTERIDISVARSKPGAIAVHAAVSSDQLDTDTTNNVAEADASVLPCTVVGTSGNDTIYGTEGPDKI